MSLHAKLIFLDRRWVCVGSMNVEPRAAHWNTGLGLLKESEPLAEEILSDFTEDLSPQSSRRVELRAVYRENAQARTNGCYQLY